MESKNNFTVENIMENIRKEISRDEIWNSPELQDVLASSQDCREHTKLLYQQLNVQSVEDIVGFAYQNYENPYYWDIGRHGMKPLVRRIIRRLLKFLLPPILERQTRYNACVAAYLEWSYKYMKYLQQCNCALKEEQSVLKQEITQLHKILETNRMNSGHD